jgi:hypothetical protein
VDALVDWRELMAGVVSIPHEFVSTRGTHESIGVQKAVEWVVLALDPMDAIGAVVVSAPDVHRLVRHVKANAAQQVRCRRLGQTYELVDRNARHLWQTF